MFMTTQNDRTPSQVRTDIHLCPILIRTLQTRLYCLSWVCVTLENNIRWGVWCPSSHDPYLPHESLADILCIYSIENNNLSCVRAAIWYKWYTESPPRKCHCYVSSVSSCVEHIETQTLLLTDWFHICLHLTQNHPSYIIHFHTSSHMSVRLFTGKVNESFAQWQELTQCV